MTDKLARLYRPSPPETFPEPDIVAMLDEERNIVFFRQDLFDEGLPHAGEVPAVHPHRAELL
jgi:hypothetical protein